MSAPNSREKVEALVIQLRTVANMINMGEKIRWAQETTLMDQAADLLETLHQELQKAQEEEVSNIIADYMEALGTVQLPQEVWLWIADINGKYLNKTLKEKI
jgi:uncharacterized membrane protein YhfC